MSSPFLEQKRFLAVLLLLFFSLTCLADQSLAHHPFEMGDTSLLSTRQAVISGIGHPLLGPDHLLFMLGIALVGLKKNQKCFFLNYPQKGL